MNWLRFFSVFMPCHGLIILCLIPIFLFNIYFTEAFIYGQLECQHYPSMITNITTITGDMYQFAILTLAVDHNRCISSYQYYLSNISQLDNYYIYQKLPLYYRCQSNYYPIELFCSTSDDYSLGENFYSFNKYQRQRLLGIMIVIDLIIVVCSCSCSGLIILCSYREGKLTRFLKSTTAQKASLKDTADIEKSEKNPLLTESLSFASTNDGHLYLSGDESDL